MHALLIFGQTGQVGRELARRAPQATLLGRGIADLSEPEGCAATIRSHRPDAVINAAVWTAVDRAETEEDAATVVNCDAPAPMARACAELGIPVVQISTDYVFDDAGTAPFAPDHPTAPLGAYGRSKLKGEEGMRAAGGVHAVLRTSWVVSAHGSNFLKTMLRLGAERDSLNVVADQIGGPTAAATIADACLCIAEALGRDPGKAGTYHFSGAPYVSWADFARAIMDRAGLGCAIADIATADWPTPARGPANSRLDCTATEAAFGIAQPDWRAGLYDILRELGA